MSDAQKDILDQLSTEARRLRVAKQLPTTGDLSPGQIKQVQTSIRHFLAQHDISQNVLAKKMGRGFSSATISSFLHTGFNPEKGIDFNGDASRIARGLNQWMETYVRSLDTPRPDGWVETNIARQMISLIRNTIEMGAIGVIYSPAGHGKTMTLEAAKKQIHQSIMVRVLHSSRNAMGLCRVIAAELGVRKTSFFDRENTIIEELKGTDRPILIDEAHQLTSDALEFVRDLHDVCGIPIVLAGTKNIYKKIQSTDDFFGQFSSRVALKYDVVEVASLSSPEGSPGSRGNSLPLHSVDEIRKLWDCDKLRLADDAVDFICRVANVVGLGGLRLCKQIIFVVSRMANGRAITASMCQQVLSQMHGIHTTTQILQSAGIKGEKRRASA